MSKETVEEAADNYSPDPSYSDEQWEFGDVIDGFIAGATWQEQQEANNAIEFADWCEDNYWPTGQVGTWWSDPISDEKMLTTHQLYCIWKLVKNK
jgi:hypothetical protein